VSNFPSVKAKDFIKVIEKLGFYLDRQKGSHAIYKDDRGNRFWLCCRWRNRLEALVYCPKQRDIIWLDFNPQRGREQANRRPALILSASEYNR
jgi:predicted RNA binding protein YcfA (HicA-like mRNA interferase family)